jgi:hypothetical protein
MSLLLYWARLLLCRCLLTLSESAFALAVAVAPEEVSGFGGRRGAWH